MRYALIALSAAVAAFALVIGLASRHPDVRTGSAAALPTVPLPTVISLPTVHVTWVPTNEVVTTRSQAIETATSTAALMYEKHPVLIDALLTTQAGARDKLRGPDGREDGPSASATGLPDNAAVWLVRMRGSFLPPEWPSTDPRLTPTPTKGWMFVVINGADGQIVGYGYVPEGYSLR